MKKEISYFIYDSRYTTNPDRAILLETCDTLKEARANKDEYGDGNVIVKATIINSVITKKEIVQ